MARTCLRRLLFVPFLLAELAGAGPTANSLPTPENTLSILERRQNSCPSAAPQSCQNVDPKLPSDFCCPTGTSCISLDSSSSALCCPSGSSCAVIQPIICDVSFEDPTKHPSGPVFTTRLTESLTQCGTGMCCPFGYTCGVGTDGSPICQVVANKAITQQPSSSTSATSTLASAARSSPPSSSGAVSTPSGASPASPSSIDSTKPPPGQSSQSHNPFPPTVFLAGFFPGMLVGALGVLAWVIVTGRHKKSDDSGSATSSVYKPKPYISGPVQPESQNARPSFHKKGNSVTKSAKSLFSKRNSDGGTPGLPFDNWKMPTPPKHNNIPDQPVGRQIPAGPGAKSIPDAQNYSSVTRYPPVTPQRQIYRDEAPSDTEMIRVYSPTNLEMPSATVAPLRGMNSREKARNSGISNSFVTPDRAMDARAPPQTTHTPAYSYEPSFEMLTPARYEGGPVQKRQRPENAEQHSRPGTTFTAMLEAINFPDPMNQSPPRVPEVPGHYRR